LDKGMDKKRRLFLITVFIFLCASLGFRGGVVAKGMKQPLYRNSPSSLISPPLRVPQANLTLTEIKVLFVFGKTEEISPSWLRGIWYAVYHPGVEGLYWFPLYPQRGVFSEETNLLLQQKFQLNAEQHVDPSFLLSLQEMAQTQWDKVIVLNQADLAKIVDGLSGIEWNGVWLNGEQASHHVALAEENYLDELQNQAAFLQAVCKRRDELRSQPEVLNSLAQLLYQQWANGSETDPKANHALEVLLNLLLQKDSLPCEFIGV